MGEFKGTPGPWVAVENADKRSDGYIRIAEPNEDGRRVAVAQATRSYWSYSQFRANTRLIAEAPNLLKALIGAVEDLETLHSSRGCEYEGSVEDLTGEYRAVIRKATEAL